MEAIELTGRDERYGEPARRDDRQRSPGPDIVEDQGELGARVGDPDGGSGDAFVLLPVSYPW